MTVFSAHIIQTMHAVTVPSSVFHFVSPLKANYVHKIHAKCYLQLTDTIFDLTHKRVNWHLKDIIQNHISKDTVEFMYFVFTCMPGMRYRRQLRSLLMCLYDVFRVLISCLVC